MVTMQQIRADLKEIRYYYAQQKDMERMSKSVGGSARRAMVDKYNAAVCKAPFRLYRLYGALYIDDNTQFGVALDWNCSADYIKQLNKQLCKFLQDELNKEEEV